MACGETDGFSLPTRTFGPLGDCYYHCLKGGDKKFLTELIQSWQSFIDVNFSFFSFPSLFASVIIV